MTNGDGVPSGPLEYVRTERVFLKTHPDFNEQWLQDQIAKEPTIIGLGDVVVIDRERVQERAGRLDLLLAAPDDNVRYELELQLGASDASHIIRTLEYWDIERRRYPGYEHVAVLVAEDITSRFLNVLQLFAGHIPFIAIQLNALRVGNQLALDFVRVLDQRLLRLDDAAEVDAVTTDRGYWNSKSTEAIVGLADTLLSAINEKATSPYQLNYNRRVIGLRSGTHSRRFIVFVPRKSWIRIRARVEDASSWAVRFEDNDINADASKAGQLRFTLTPKELEQHRELVTAMLHRAVEEFEG